MHMASEETGEEALQLWGITLNRPIQTFFSYLLTICVNLLKKIKKYIVQISRNPILNCEFHRSFHFLGKISPSFPKIH